MGAFVTVSCAELHAVTRSYADLVTRSYTELGSQHYAPTTTTTTPTTTSTTTAAEITSDRTDGFEGSYVSIDSDDWSTINKEKNGYLGCDDHYAPNGHAVLEGDIVDGVKTVMGW